MSIHYMISVFNFLGNCLQDIGYNCSQLQYLNLGWCENVGDIGVMSLAYGCPDLRALDLCGCVLITGNLYRFRVVNWYLNFLSLCHSIKYRQQSGLGSANISVTLNFLYLCLLYLAH